MNSKRILILLAGLLLVVPALAWAQPAVGDSMILEEKSVNTGLAGDPAFVVKLYVTNNDTVTYMVLSVREHTTLGSGYADLDDDGAGGRDFPDVVNAVNNQLDRSTFFDAPGYDGASPDSFIIAGGFAPTPSNPRARSKPGPALVRDDVWEIRFKGSSGIGNVSFTPIVLGQPTGFAVIQWTPGNPNPSIVDKSVNFIGGPVHIIEQFNFLNCSGAGGNVLYGRPYSYDFNTDQDPAATFAVAVGPGSISPTGVYTFSGQCPLGAIPVIVEATSPAGSKIRCEFTLNIIDNAPSCTPAQPTVTVSHGALAANQINTSDPDAGDNVSVSQTSGPGTTSGSGAWSYQTTCSDVGASPQTVQEQVVDGFGNCQPGPLSATCQFQLVVTNAAPNLTCGPDAQVQAGSHYSKQLSATDADPADAGNLSYSLNVGPPGLTVSASGLVEWDPTAADAGCHEVSVRATDLCGAIADCRYQICVVVGERFKICIDQIGPQGVYQGTDVDLSIRNVNDATDPDLANGKSVGGFSFLLSYDCTCLQFLSARKGALLNTQGWEFFTYRYGAVGNGNCGAGCPSCLIRIVAIADVNNGASHPNLTQVNQGEWAVLRFRISNDRTLAGQCCAVNWFWFDCNDNTVSDSTGNTLWVVEQLLSVSGTPIPLNGFPNDVSNCDAFSGGPDKPTPKKFLIFCNGQICLPTPEEIDDRGDLNLNGVLNDIGDAVLYENYFIYGPGVLDSDPVRRQSQIAASDVNADGIVLSVADLVTMIRIITGDANPFPRMNPAAGAVSIALGSSGSEWTLSANSASDLGGLYLKFKVDGSVGNVALTGAAEGMTLKSNLIGNELSVLVYSEARDRMIAPNAGAILSMDLHGNAELVSSEATDYYGISLPTLAKVTPLPTSFALSQNYPNPFNGKTSFTLALPVASDYTVTVYNVTGQVVRTFEGSAPAGNRTITWDGTDNNGMAVSSGIYFYKAVAKDFSAVQRMLFLK